MIDVKTINTRLKPWWRTKRRLPWKKQTWSCCDLCANANLTKILYLSLFSSTSLFSRDTWPREGLSRSEQTWQSEPGVCHWAASWLGHVSPVSAGHSQCVQTAPGSPCYKQLWHLTVWKQLYKVSRAKRTRKWEVSFNKVEEYVESSNILETCYLNWSWPQPPNNRQIPWMNRVVVFDHSCLRNKIWTHIADSNMSSLFVIWG